MAECPPTLPFRLPPEKALLPSDDFISIPETAAVMVARSRPMKQVLDQVSRVAGTKLPVLIEGETGTGKELLARYLHYASARASQPFIRLNCAALSETLVESEFFGHEKGAFTGADEGRPGRFERAHKGTLLLDEIGEMSVRLQAKLLRVLEEEELERVGGSKTLQVDVRIVATTNRNLEDENRRGEFRRDLLYRLNALQLRLPPLRERQEDIPVLVQHFVNAFRHESPAAVAAVAPRVMRLLQEYHWPGNIRQLRNVLRRGCILARGAEIQEHDLPPLEGAPAPTVVGKTIAIMERELILATLQAVGGNKTEAARILGVTARTLLNKMNLYNERAA